MRATLVTLLLLALTGSAARAEEVVIPGPDGERLGAVEVETVFLDRVEAELSPAGDAAAVSVRHGRHGGASLVLVERGRRPRVLLETTTEETLSPPAWSPEGKAIAVVRRGPARREPGELFLRQGGGLWVCARAGGCAPRGEAGELWRVLALSADGRALATRALPGDLVVEAPVLVDAAGRGPFELPAGLLASLGITLDEPPIFPAPPSALDRPLPELAPDQPLAMPYIHQVYDTPNAFNGHWACGPTSTLMCIQHYGRLGTWPITVDVPYSHNSDYGAYVSEVYTAYGTTFDAVGYDASGNAAYGAYGWCTIDGSAWAYKMQDYAARHDLTSDFDGSSTFGEVQAAIDAGKVIPMSTRLTNAGHIIAVKGYTGDGRLITNDPYGDRNEPSYPNYNGEGAVYTWAQVNSGWFNTVYGSGAVETDDSEFVAQSVLDGTHMAPNTAFTQRWTLRNIGTSTWTRAGNYLFTYDGEERYSASEQILLPEGASVAPQQTWDWDVPMVAPATPGSYRGYFRMDRFGTARFGTRVYLDLIVDDYPDADGDGSRADVDCDDGDASVHPGAAESCNGLDENCDGQVDEGVLNRCGACGPEPAEECNGADDDCDGEVDEGCGPDGSTEEDGGAQEDGQDGAGPDDGAPPADGADAGADPGTDRDEPVDGGCGCASGASPLSPVGCLAGLLLLRRRRHRRA
ncbi:MAG TPA: NBR1-Ig-like domain-containing protein [Myxococcota bacterium]|nr:NBR1-Ig-like domain-containing protein [Myxococcota bacterium]HRY93450.1 NBR1-Ig-like domain-containing protein [Myxococcota bacterium]HSA20297.1 NBR1-Ig-like domain-containing protein [Myxococcota bacterium]